MGLLFVAQLVGGSPNALAEPALTYSAHQYLQLESRIQEALKNGTVQTLNPLLSNEFRFHRPSSPNLSKQEWFAAQSANRQQEWQIRDVEVQVLGDIRIVSFTKLDTSRQTPLFIVDVWSHAQQKLLSRYEAAASLPLPQPPVGPGSATPDKNHMRPDGRG